MPFGFCSVKVMPLFIISFWLLGRNDKKLACSGLQLFWDLGIFEANFYMSYPSGLEIAVGLEGMELDRFEEEKVGCWTGVGHIKGRCWTDLGRGRVVTGEVYGGEGMLLARCREARQMVLEKCTEGIAWC